MIDRRNDASTLYIRTYADKALQSNRFSKSPEDVEKLRFGLFGEVGGILAGVKKASRDKLGISLNQAITEELGDALWYLFALVWSLDFDADKVARLALEHIRSQVSISGPLPRGAPSFRHLDSTVQANAAPEDGLQAQVLSRIAQSAANLTVASGEDQKACATLLGDLAMVCGAFDDRLEDIAQANLDKTHKRWPPESERLYGEHLDADSSLKSYERMPRQFDMVFEEREINGKRFVVQSINDVYIGDPLTDNHTVEDFYRFHDVFHLAYLAHLSWSPVLRGLMKRKRKSQQSKDENEDGARAMIIEEGIATWIFNHAQSESDDTHYADIKVGELPYSLLKQIASMVAGYEVEVRPAWQWEQAIIDGFVVFRQLKTHRKGIVRVDIDNHTIAFIEREQP
jgi:NTP pyrophosphatase (non-canonical NTP hydrolase)